MTTNVNKIRNNSTVTRLSPVSGKFRHLLDSVSVKIINLQTELGRVFNWGERMGLLQLVFAGQLPFLSPNQSVKAKKFSKCSLCRNSNEELVLHQLVLHQSPPRQYPCQFVRASVCSRRSLPASKQQKIYRL